MKKIFLIFTILFYILSVSAQDLTVTMSMAEYKVIEAREDSLKNQLEQLSAQIGMLEKVLVQKNDSIKVLKKQLTASDNKALNRSTLISNLQDTIINQNEELKKLQQELASLDMVRLRYANGRLELPYDNKKIEEAKEIFDGVQDPELKTKYQELIFWLDHYGECLDAVTLLITKLQADPRRDNIFKFEEWKVYALQEINSNEYNRKRKGYQFSIPYLNDILSTAKSRLEKSKDQPNVDFSDLIERLNPKR